MLAFYSSYSDGFLNLTISTLFRQLVINVKDDFKLADIDIVTFSLRSDNSIFF